MNLKILRSIDYQNILDEFVNNEIILSLPNNSGLWVQMGNQLEIEGVKKSQISTIMRKDIEDRLWELEYKDKYARQDYRYCNSNFYKVMKNNGWTDSFMARNVNIDPHMDQEIVPSNNKHMKITCDDIINLCRVISKKSNDCDQLEYVFGEKYMKEFYLQLHTAVNNCKNSIDYKTKVPTNTEVFLLESLSMVTGSVNKCAEVFMKNNLLHLQKQGKFFTSKQSNKFQKGMKQSQQLCLKPTSRETAIFSDYSGVQCVCGSWRCRSTSELNKIECYDCDNIFTAQYFPKCTNCYIVLYKERLAYIVKTGKCRDCDVTLDLPSELIQYAKSTDNN